MNNIGDCTSARTTFPKTSRRHQHLQHSITNKINDIRSENIFDNRPKNIIPDTNSKTTLHHKTTHLSTLNNTPSRTILEIELLLKLHLTQHPINSNTPATTPLRTTLMTAQRKTSFLHHSATNRTSIYQRMKPTRPQPTTNQQSITSLRQVTTTPIHYRTPAPQ